MIAPPKPPAHDELEALIKEARERQLRRRLLGAAGIAVAEETTEAAPAAQAQAAPEDQTAEAEAPAESKPVEKSPEQSTASTAPAEAPAPAAAAEPETTPDGPSCRRRYRVSAGWSRVRFSGILP